MSFQAGYRPSIEIRRKLSEAAKRRTDRFDIGSVWRGKKIPPDVVEKFIGPRRGKLRQPPAVRRGPTHWHSKHCVLRSPNGQVFDVVNIVHFVATSPHLFQPEDVQFQDGVGGRRCRASHGLQSLFQKNDTRLSWKGWTRVSIIEEKSEKKFLP